MAIHHSTKTRAEKLGVILTELSHHINLDGGGTPSHSIAPQFPDALPPSGTVQAYWPKFNVYAFGAGEKPAQAAVEEMIAIQTIKDKIPESSIVNDTNDPFLVRVFLTHEREQVLDRDGSTPKDALLMIEQDKVWQSTTIPLDGGEAHKQGFPITDNPHDEEEDGEDFANWDAAWEASADEADAEDSQEDAVGGSVVRSEYRIRYAERGHPAHCGDWLAETLNSLILGKTQTDLEKFEAICALNGVDTTKYKREGTGWQGRIRMTGRNLLAKRVFEAGGVLLLPVEVRPEPGVEQLQAPADWMSAQRFKGKKPPAPVVDDGRVAE